MGGKLAALVFFKFLLPGFNISLGLLLIFIKNNIVSLPQILV
jgi:hypothetical protein